MNNTKKAIIFGSEGQIGHFLIPELLTHKFDIIGITHRHKFQLTEKPKHKIRVGDIRDSFFINNLVAKQIPDIIINLAAISMPDECNANNKGALECNVTGVLNILEAIIKYSPNTVFINAGSIHELNPAKKGDFYTITKTMSRSIVDLYRRKHNISSYQIYIGLNDSEYRDGNNFSCQIIDTINAAKSGSHKTLYIYNINQEKYWSYSGDVGEQIAKISSILVEKNCNKNFVKTGRIAILGDKYKMKQFIELALELSGLKWNLYKGAYFTSNSEVPVFVTATSSEYPNEPELMGDVFIRKANKTPLTRIVESLF